MQEIQNLTFYFSYLMFTVCSFIPELQKKQDSFSLHCPYENSLSPTSVWHIKKTPKTSKRVWLQFSIESSFVFVIISQQERPHNYTKKFSTGICITTSILTSLLCLSGAWVSQISRRWFVLTSYNLYLISRQKLLWAILAGGNFLYSLQFPLQHYNIHQLLIVN